MCVKILSNNVERKFNVELPLDEQISKGDQIVIKYEPFDSEIDYLVKEIQRFVNSGIDSDLNIKVEHGNNINGLKINKLISQANRQMRLNDIIRLMVLSQREIDSKLDELVKECHGIALNVRR